MVFDEVDLRTLADCIDAPVEIWLQNSAPVRNKKFVDTFSEFEFEGPLCFSMIEEWEFEPGLNLPNILHVERAIDGTQMYLAANATRTKGSVLVNSYKLTETWCILAGQQCVIFSFLDFRRTEEAREDYKNFRKLYKGVSETHAFEAPNKVHWFRARSGESLPNGFEKECDVEPSGDFFAYRYFDQQQCTKLINSSDETLHSRTISITGDSTGTGRRAAELSLLILNNINHHLYTGKMRSATFDDMWGPLIELEHSAISEEWLDKNQSKETLNNPAWRVLRWIHTLGCSIYERRQADEDSTLPGAEVAAFVLDHCGETNEKTLYWANSGLMAFNLEYNQEGLIARSLDSQELVTGKNAKFASLITPDWQDKNTSVRWGAEKRPQGIYMAATDGLGLPKPDFVSTSPNGRRPARRLDDFATQCLRGIRVHPEERASAYNITKQWRSQLEAPMELHDDLTVSLLFCD